MKEKLENLIRRFEHQHPNKVEHTSKSLKLLEKFKDNTTFLRTCFDDGHFTGSVLVINREKTKVLLMHHIKLGTWQQFGGHADGEIDIRSVAIRELEEEAWIYEKDANIPKDILNIDVHLVPAHKWEPDHYHYDISFLAVVDKNITFEKQEEEVNEIQWFDILKVKKELESWKYASGLCKIIENI